MQNLFYLLVLSILLGACTGTSSTDANQEASPLPYLGRHQVSAGDTVLHHIPDFTFVNQDSQLVTNETFAGKPYIADFFFTSCPTICPKVKKQMLRLYEKYEGTDLRFLSHSIDTKRDTVGRLADYAESLGASSDRWMFVTGDKDDIYAIADDYMSTALENPDAPGGFDHSGWLILIDGDGHLRSFTDGTDEEKVTAFTKDIDWLLANK